ncbi:hypothetical protein OJAV_G00168070 [Oryzias javanicus]|uniref:Uncharacterized protein n=1 Tax=Oryzias javanicus TaxID=123683 RepID=A0A3S2P0H6_ORYJA|nr:hypothetical protein OJAV_G00168070 [Oryzias javanicus]
MKNEDNDDFSPIDSLSEEQPEIDPPEEFIETLVSPKDPSEGDAPKSDDECQQSVLEMIESTKNACQDLILVEQEGGVCQENHELWIDLEDVVCEVIEEKENEQSEAEGTEVMKEEEEEDRQTGSGSEEKTVKAHEAETNKSEVREESEGEAVKTPAGKFTNSSAGKAETANQETCDLTEEDGDQNREGDVQETDRENKELDGEPSRAQQSADKSMPKENNDSGTGDISTRGVGRKLVVSKQPKVYQVKAVPVVPPKPQHCKITALTLRQQQKERLEADKGRDGPPRVQPEPDREARDGAEESLERQERQITLRERRRDGADRDGSSRNSPLSLCFDEAVAIATLRREKERARDGEVDVDRLGK